jgi:hypothetical protein
MSCRETPGSSACVTVACAHSTLDESQVRSVLNAGMAEAHEYGLHASEEEYRDRLSGFQQQLSDDPTGFAGRAQDLADRLAVGLIEWQPDPGRRYALVSLQDRVSMAERHLCGLVGRWSVVLRERPEITMRRYDAYRAEAQLNPNCRAPQDFARGLAVSPFTWAAPRDRVTAWALYRLAQDVGAEPRPVPSPPAAASPLRRCDGEA